MWRTEKKTIWTKKKVGTIQQLSNVTDLQVFQKKKSLKKKNELELSKTVATILKKKMRKSYENQQRSCVWCSDGVSLALFEEGECFFFFLRFLLGKNNRLKLFTQNTCTSLLRWFKLTKKRNYVKNDLSNFYNYFFCSSSKSVEWTQSRLWSKGKNYSCILFMLFEGVELRIKLKLTLERKCTT